MVLHADRWTPARTPRPCPSVPNANALAGALHGLSFAWTRMRTSPAPALRRLRCLSRVIAKHSHAWARYSCAVQHFPGMRALQRFDASVIVLAQMKIVQALIALACLLAGADAFGTMPPATCTGHTGNLALPANWGMSCAQVTPGYDPEKNNPDGSISTTQCMRPSVSGHMHGDHGHPMNQVPLADNFLELTVSATKANATCMGEPAFKGYTLRVAVADVCPEACGKPCANAPTENVPAEFIAGMFNQAPGFSCDSGLTSYCAGNQPVAWFCPKVCGKYNECSFNMGAPANAGGAVVPATAAVAAVACANDKVACGTAAASHRRGTSSRGSQRWRRRVPCPHRRPRPQSRPRRAQMCAPRGYRGSTRPRPREGCRPDSRR